MRNIQLRYSGLTQLVEASNFYLIMLNNMEETRQIAIVCDDNFERAVSMRLTEKADMNKYLPEVLCHLNPMLNSDHYEVLINGIADGEYKVFLICKDDLSYTPVRASDAILIALIAQLEIYIEEKFFNFQSSAIHINKERISLPINVMNSDMLSSALNKAIASEDYELASYIRDELNKRTNREKN